jgi:hypothetical protein
MISNRQNHNTIKHRTSIHHNTEQWLANCSHGPNPAVYMFCNLNFVGTQPCSSAYVLSKTI